MNFDTEEMLDFFITRIVRLEQAWLEQKQSYVKLEKEFTAYRQLVIEEKKNE